MTSVWTWTRLTTGFRRTSAMIWLQIGLTAAAPPIRSCGINQSAVRFQDFYDLTNSEGGALQDAAKEIVAVVPKRDAEEDPACVGIPVGSSFASEVGQIDEALASRGRLSRLGRNY